jgi:hypothetical protein
MNIKEVSKRKIDVKNAWKYIGQEMAIVGKVSEYSQKDDFIAVYLGEKYPNQLMTVVLKGGSEMLIKHINGRKITVIGTIISYNGKPEIMVNNIDQIKY